jgi:hypothetical protein
VRESYRERRSLLRGAVVDTPAVVGSLGHIRIEEDATVILVAVPVLKSIASPSVQVVRE